MDCCMPCRSNVKVMDDYSSRGCNGAGKQKNYMRNSPSLSNIHRCNIVDKQKEWKAARNVPESDRQGQCLVVREGRRCQKWSCLGSGRET